MSIEIARYQFHAWTRKGISSKISDPDDLGTGSSTEEERATIQLPVAINGEGLTKGFTMIGPGDIIGINPDMIIRTEPLNYVTDFEPNYLAFVEFYDEDFATRYTPAKPVDAKLRPWLLLLVLKEEEFIPGKQKKPLPSISILNNDVFPSADESWLWSHVHSNTDIPDEELSNYEIFLQSLGKTMNDDPDQYYSRLLCPRKLDPNTAYHAFIVPAFETGRLAGLAQPTAGIPAQAASWSETGAKGEMPVYYQWYFRTGINEDFESLVKLLEPRKMDPKLGIRPMDAEHPGFRRVDSVEGLHGTQPPVLGLEGALKAPTTVSTIFPDPTKPNLFQAELEKIVNLPFEIIGTDTSGDPIISVPLYGGKHAKKLPEEVVKLNVADDRWVNDLNRDPRTRVAAGFGTTVIQLGQENYMRQAWQQVDTILQANKQIKLTAFYMKVAFQFTLKTFNKVSPDHLVAISRPLLKRIMGSPTTLYQQIKESPLPAAVFAPAFRRVTRKGTKLIKNIGAEKSYDYSNLVSGLNEGTITAAPPKVVASGMVTTETIADNIKSNTIIPDWLNAIIKNKNAILVVLLVLFALIAIATGAFTLMVVLATAAVAGYWYTGRIADQKQVEDEGAAAIMDPANELKILESVPQRPGFTLKLEGEAITPAATSTSAGVDSVEAANFREALTAMDKRLAIAKPGKTPVKITLSNLHNKVRDGIHPHTTFASRLKGMVQFPHYINVEEPERVLPVMAYPDFEDPMYKGLTAISSELLLPNLKLVPPNTISLLKVNQKFIESYMVGLNHEMGRELLWREYPTDERGSYFRQFWDVNGVIRPGDGKTDAQRREEFKDINPIHTWDSTSLLGSHNKREPVAGEEQLVLLIRGDLLKRYPNTLIFAQKAIAKPAAEIDPGIDTELDDIEFPLHVKFPLYRAEINPDIKFFGFDLTIEQARGTSPTDGFTDNLGWFFIIQEVPGEPRFGMDIQTTNSPTSWADLSWDNFSSTPSIIKKSLPPTIAPADVVTWGADSAAMAYILFQKPSMVAVHAKGMLENLTN
jgi:hypothetical protein